MHTSDSTFSVGSTKNVSHQSPLTPLWQHLMAQDGSSANPLKKNLVSGCVNLTARRGGEGSRVGVLQRATQFVASPPTPDPSPPRAGAWRGGGGGKKGSGARRL